MAIITKIEGEKIRERQCFHNVLTELFDGLERRILLKLDQIHADIKTAIGLQSVNQEITSASDVFEVLEEPCKSVEELEELCEKLKAAEFRKKIVCAATNAVLYYAAISWHCSLITDCCCLHVDSISLSSECWQFGGWH